MSDSRLEKFIYAICSMDVSDLPVPLSRIEKLWNCLITGETPDFEPLSRNEKYLMAMLDRYDISNLPAPMSRGEKLLYKIAVGETDLSDVPGYLSRYEELLKYLIENGGISGGDFEYVLYTLNQSLSTLYATVEKPVKSAILKGQTLVNIFDNSLLYGFNYCTINSDGSLTMNAIGRYTECNFKLSSYIGKKVTIFIIFDENTIDVESYNLQFPIFGHNNFTRKEDRYLKKYVGVVEDDYLRFGLKPDVTSGSIKFKFMVIEGDFLNQDIPYFTGMQSVKMPVLTTTDKSPTIIPFNVFENAEFKNVGGFTSIPLPYELVDVKCIIKIREDYPHNIKFQIGDIKFTDAGDTLIKGKEYVKYIPAMNDIRIYNWADIRNGNGKEPFLNALKDGSISITLLKDGCKLYPYYGNDAKTNILTVNEDVELRGIGEVQDTLDCLTGEVTKRVLEYSITGDEGWVKHSTTNTFYTMDGIVKYSDNKRNVISDKFYGRYVPSNTWLSNMEICVFGSKIGIGFDGTLEELIEYLKLNNPRIFYVDEEKSVKTVDLTTVDQDGQPTKLKTFNDITHVEINADNLIPSVDVEVATKISETLSTLGLEHHDISNTQNELGQTIDEQAENTDATMMATTEIYENL